MEQKKISDLTNDELKIIIFDEEEEISFKSYQVKGLRQELANRVQKQMSEVKPKAKEDAKEEIKEDAKKDNK